MSVNQNNSNSNSNEEIIKRVEIPNTPFVAVRLQNEPFFLTLGKYRISGYEADTIEQMQLLMENNKWELITTISGIIAEHTFNTLKENTNGNN